MKKEIRTFLNSLLSPACIVDKRLHILEANADFLSVADVSKKEINEGLALNKCIHTDFFTNWKNCVDIILTQGKCIKKNSIKARNHKGEELILSIRIISTTLLAPGSNSIMIIFSSKEQGESTVKRYKYLYEKEKAERKEIEKHTSITFPN